MEVNAIRDLVIMDLVMFKKMKKGRKCHFLSTYLSGTHFVPSKVFQWEVLCPTVFHIIILIFIGEELVTQEVVKYTDQESHLLSGNAWI